MAVMLHSAAAETPALVAESHGRYLLISPQGAPQWVADPGMATAFASMREATRMATRLPAVVKAFGLPRHLEIDAAAHLQ